ncbi:galactitol-1-phosphate 5-dehydrogenase [Vagococcus sp. BWB3-3]|uniref:Galactitol-1-phosphate 5-dehydrogenase n=1 Tax=Vagococcus allomyrinae TaxID=2794353 RepID=A0A940PAN5_9ENTE|nr:galactitol-1-phosphate 5-dehydrogenase [Vagococcus allomyrinae]
MKALAVTGIETFELQKIDKPKPSKKEVLIKVAYVGVCGSDLPRYFDGGVHQFPQVLGHEFSGTISEVGEEVELPKGARVAVAPLVPCNKCEQCYSGSPQLCPNYSFIGSRQQGAMAEYIVVPEANCLVVPDDLALKVAATIEPLTVAIHGIERVRTKAGDKTLVIGAGTIGLMTVLALRARGVGEITVIDLNDEKLALAKEIGADVTVNPLNVDIDHHFKENGLANLVFETAGTSITQVQSIIYANRQAKVSFIGTCTRPINFEAEEFELILRRELELTGSWMSYSAPFPGFEWHSALRYLATGVIDTLPLITSIYSLEDQALPFEKMREKASREVKVLYEIGGEM